MEVFDLTRGTTTGTVRVPAKAGETAQFKIRSTKAKKVNGKSQTPERIAFTYSYANQAVVRASWEEDPSNAELYIVPYWLYVQILLTPKIIPRYLSLRMNQVMY